MVINTENTYHKCYIDQGKDLNHFILEKYAQIIYRHFQTRPYVHMFYTNPVDSTFPVSSCRILE